MGGGVGFPAEDPFTQSSIHFAPFEQLCSVVSVQTETESGTKGSPRGEQRPSAQQRLIHPSSSSMPNWASSDNHSGSFELPSSVLRAEHQQQQKQQSLLDHQNNSSLRSVHDSTVSEKAPLRGTAVKTAQALRQVGHANSDSVVQHQERGRRLLIASTMQDQRQLSSGSGRRATSARPR